MIDSPRQEFDCRCESASVRTRLPHAGTDGASGFCRFEEMAVKVKLPEVGVVR